MAKDNKKQNKVNFFVALASELKQVSWLSISETMKRLGAVLVVTFAFLLVMIGIDALLGFIHNELFSIKANQRYLTTEQIIAVVISLVLILGSVAGYVVYKLKSKKDTVRGLGL